MGVISCGPMGSKTRDLGHLTLSLSQPFPSCEHIIEKLSSHVAGVNMCP